MEMIAQIHAPDEDVSLLSIPAKSYPNQLEMMATGPAAMNGHVIADMKTK